MVDLHNTSTYIIRYKFHDFWSQFSIQVNILRYTGLRFFFRRNLGSTHSSVQEMMQTKGDESIIITRFPRSLTEMSHFKTAELSSLPQIIVFIRNFAHGSFQPRLPVSLRHLCFPTTENYSNRFSNVENTSLNLLSMY